MGYTNGGIKESASSKHNDTDKKLGVIGDNAHTDNKDWEGIDNILLDASDTTNISDAEAATQEIMALARDDNKVWDALVDMVTTPAQYDLEPPLTARALVDAYNEYSKTDGDKKTARFDIVYDGMFEGNKRCAYIRRGQKTVDAILSYSSIENGCIDEKFAVMHIKNDSSLGTDAIKGWFYEQTGEVLDYQRSNTAVDYFKGFGACALLAGFVAAIAGGILYAFHLPTVYALAPIAGLYVTVMGGVTYFAEKGETSDKNGKIQKNSVAIATMRKNGKTYDGNNLAELVVKMDDQIKDMNAI